jgi:predicted molibdopterin-dependent oxidoreductase YjgC
MFRPISKRFSHSIDQSAAGNDHALEFTFDGRGMLGRDGDSLAVSLLVNGVEAFRETPVSGVKRGPYCLMGVCFDCLVVIDGVGNRQACLTPVRQGMVVETQHGARDLDSLEKADR